MVEPIITGIAAAATTSALEKTTARLVDSISFKFAKEKYEVVKFVLSRGLPAYLAANYAKCETLKTLLNRNDPIALTDCFVAPDFNLKGAIISSTAFLDHINQSGDKVVITGLAGSGKSVFLKYSFSGLSTTVTLLSYIFELRSLNSLPPKPDAGFSQRQICFSQIFVQADYRRRSLLLSYIFRTAVPQ